MEHGHLVCKLTTLLHQQYLQLILQTQLAHSAGWELDIKQWGLSGATGAGYGGIIFPLAFSNTDYAVICMHNGTDPLIVSEYVSQRYKSQTTWMACDKAGNKLDTWSVRYIAIGK